MKMREFISLNPPKCPERGIEFSRVTLQTLKEETPRENKHYTNGLNIPSTCPNV